MGLRRQSGSDAAATDTGTGPAAAATTTTAGRRARRARRARKAGAAADSTGSVESPSAGATRGQRARRNRKPLTASRAKRMIGVSTAVAPLLAPYALAAAGVARARWDAHRAARLGVAPGQLSAYTGPGGALHARLSRIAEALNELDSGAEAHATGAARRFALDTRPRLADLSVAVRAAEQMPTGRRRTAYQAIGGELDRIETGILTHLGVAT